MSNRNIKRIIALVICVILAVSILPVSALACGPKGNNGRGKGCQKNPHYEKVCATVDAANASIYALVKIAQATPYDDTAWLLRSVDAIADSTFKLATKFGVAVECEYEAFYVDGKVVYIDPIRVIN